MKSAISLLQQWYARHCDDDWEHSYGVRIDTLDNPGWMLAVDLNDTELSEAFSPPVRVDRSDADWLQFEVSNGKYMAYGGALNLEEMIRTFLRFADEYSAGEC